MRWLKRILIGYATLVAAAVAGGLVVRKTMHEHGSEADDDVAIVCVMGGRRFTSTAPSLSSMRVLAYMGGVELDLTDAEIVDGAVLDLTTFMGGVDVIVPASWRVETHTNVIMGGVENRTSPDDTSDAAPLLIIECTTVMGGIEIHGETT